MTARADLLTLYRCMLRIRRVEERMESLYHLDRMETPIHLCIGQEAVSAGVCLALRVDDTIQSNHRGHGHYLAKGGNLNAMIAELYGRESGCAHGRGGSMHLVDRSVGHCGSSAIVGGGIPLGTGQALAMRMRGEDRVSVVFLGDGAADEGVLYESVNFAILKRLPVLYILENNQGSVCSRVEARRPHGVLFHHLPQDMLPSRKLDGNDVLAVYEAACEMVASVRSDGGPAFLECVTYRWRGHAGSYSGADVGYRTAEEIAEWEARCPLLRLERKLLEGGELDKDAIANMEEDVASEIDKAFVVAEAASPADPTTLTDHLFAMPGGEGPCDAF